MKSLDIFLKDVDVNRLKAAFFMLLGIVVIGGFALFINTYLYKSRASNETVNIGSYPTEAVWPLNQNQNVDMRITPDAAGNKISGFDITYVVEAPVEVVSVGVPVAVGDASVVFTKVIQSGNRISYVIQGEPLAGVVSIPFVIRGTNEGKGTLTVDRDKSKVIGNISSYSYEINGVGIPSYAFVSGVPPTGEPSQPPLTGDPPMPTIPKGYPTVDAVIKTMLLKFQGVTTEVTPKMSIALTAVSSTGTRSDAVMEFVSGADGVWSNANDILFPEVVIGEKYYILVKGPKSIQKKVCSARPTETAVGSYTCGQGEIDLSKETTLDFSGIRIMAGDLAPQDGQVDSYDLSYILNNLGSTAESITAVGDVNLNGRVDTQDYSLLIQSLTIKSDEQ